MLSEIEKSTIERVHVIEPLNDCIESNDAAQSGWIKYYKYPKKKQNKINKHATDKKKQNKINKKSCVPIKSHEYIHNKKSSFEQNVTTTHKKTKKAMSTGQKIKSIDYNQPIYNEMSNMPKDFDDAINKKQNLTLMQILILMNLHAIPKMIMNDIHDKLQTKIRIVNKVKIFENSKEFYSSQYGYNDLLNIKTMIEQIIFMD